MRRGMLFLSALVVLFSVGTGYVVFANGFENMWNGQESLDTTEQIAGQLVGDVILLNGQKQQLEVDLEFTRQERDGYMWQLGICQGELAAALALIDTLNAQILILEADLAAADIVIAELIAERDLLLIEVSDLEAEIVTLEALIAALEATIISMQAEIDALLAALAARDAEIVIHLATIAGHEATILSQQAEIAALLVIQADLEADLAAADAMIASLTVERDLLIIERDLLLLELADCLECCDILQATIDARDAQIALLEAQIASLQGDVIYWQDQFDTVHSLLVICIELKELAELEIIALLIVIADLEAQAVIDAQTIADLQAALAACLAEKVLLQAIIDANAITIQGLIDDLAALQVLYDALLADYNLLLFDYNSLVPLYDQAVLDLIAANQQIADLQAAIVLLEQQIVALQGQIMVLTAELALANAEILSLEGELALANQAADDMLTDICIIVDTLPPEYRAAYDVYCPAP